jgi:hypothetical protein
MLSSVPFVRNKAKWYRSGKFEVSSLKQEKAIMRNEANLARPARGYDGQKMRNEANLLESNAQNEPNFSIAAPGRSRG